ncbi:MAG: DUF4157 domain-containing protein [Bacteroidia bacterium]|nr:DUF4157 domain-containing protein [Bacteroidia bacterium]
MASAVPPNSGSKTARYQQIANESPQVKQLMHYQHIANSRLSEKKEKGGPQSGQSEGGLPLQLKSGMEATTGYDLSDVKVHYNSRQPAQMQAHAFAQGNDIHLGPGQEKHLGHELGHVVQQKQGLVRPTTEVNGAAVNDDIGLENSADQLGAKATAFRETDAGQPTQLKSIHGQGIVQRLVCPPNRNTRYKMYKHLKWYRDLDSDAQDKINLLHKKRKKYKKDVAIRLATGPDQNFLMEMASGVDGNMFGRFGKSGPGYLTGPQELGFGVHYGTKNFGNSSGFDESRYGTSDPLNDDFDFQGSTSYGKSGQDLTPIGTQRDKSQNKVMGNLSPNEAAFCAGLTTDENTTDWEWLHLVAFSIGETHVSDLSDESALMINNFEQEQQIAENLVLGTSASNTAMIIFEEAIKDALRTHQNLRVHLIAMADGAEITIQPRTKIYKLFKAHRIRYHFMFFSQNGNNQQVAEPVLVDFDTLSHDIPLEQNINVVKSRIFQSLTNLQQVPNPIQGPYINGMSQAQRGWNQNTGYQNQNQPHLDWDKNKQEIENLPRNNTYEVEDPGFINNLQQMALPYYEQYLNQTGYLQAMTFDQWYPYFIDQVQRQFNQNNITNSHNRGDSMDIN